MTTCGWCCGTGERMDRDEVMTGMHRCEFCGGTGKKPEPKKVTPPNPEFWKERDD